MEIRDLDHLSHLLSWYAKGCEYAIMFAIESLRSASSQFGFDNAGEECCFEESYTRWYFCCA